MVDEKYKFTEKERDNETNYDYFGARYYNSKIGLWNSADPMADKYPGLSPYNYCVGNPLRIIDPNGETIYILDEGCQYTYKNGKVYKNGEIYSDYIDSDGDYIGYLGEVVKSLREIENGGPNGKYLISYLVNSEKIVTIKEFDDKIKQNTYYNKFVYWEEDDWCYGGNAFGNSAGDPVLVDGFIALAHELGHAWDLFKHGYLDQSSSIGTNSKGGAILKAEKTSCGIENLIRAEHGLQRRYYYENNQGIIDDYSFEK